MKFPFSTCTARITFVIAAFSLMGILSFTTLAQGPDDAFVKKETPKANRARGLNMLMQVKQVIESKYYDPTFGGIDLDVKFKTADERIRTLERNADIYRTIADAVIGLGVSHMTFYPPNLLYGVEYGFSMMSIGNGCFVVSVKRGSDAEVKGLKPGDQILTIGGQPVTRDNLRLIKYIFYTLEPQTELSLKVRDADRKEREIVFKSRLVAPEEQKGTSIRRRDDESAKPFTCVAVGSEVAACKLRTFATEKSSIDKMMAEASMSKKLILDLRGNGGGYVETLSHLTSWFFDRNVKIGTEKTRSKSKERIAKGRAKDAYKGEVIVLIDSQSASASEVLARVLQIEKRARIVGDASMGAVMTSVLYEIATEARPGALPTDFYVPTYKSYIYVAIGDLIMSDGGRIEGFGVMPDLPTGPTQLAMLQGLDPVLSYTTELLGSPISPEAAGKLNFLVPKPESASDKEDDENTGK